MGQTWEQLLFAHWPVPVAALRRVVPRQLPLDTHDGTAWVGVTPFRVRGARLRLTAPVPGLSAFPETNVRTYVTVDGKPGIYFLSLDADSRLAVDGARRVYRLPYFRAKMRVSMDGCVDYASRRVDPSGPPAELACRYESVGPPFQAQRGSLEYFLTERYCLYTLDQDQRLYRADIHHQPWPLRQARATFHANTMGEPLGVKLDEEPILHLAERQDVVIWPIASIEATPR